MAEGGLSIGVLSGKIDLDDNFTATIHLSAEALDALEKQFGKAGAGAKEVAAGMFVAEGAIEAVKEIAHLAAEGLKEITIEGAKVADVEENFNRLALGAGQLGDELLGTLKQGTHDTITDFQLMQSVNDNLAAGVNLTAQQYNTLATGAFALAQAKGADVKESFDKINDALLTGRVRGVQYLTGKIDMAEAEEAYANKLNTTVERLTPLEKQEAAREAILAKVGAATEKLGEQTDGLDEKLDQAAVSWGNFTEDLGKTVATSPVILQAFDDIRDTLTEAFGVDKEQAIQDITHAIEESAKAAVTLVEVGVDVVKFLVDYREVIEPVGVGIVTYYTAVFVAEKATKLWAGSIALLEGGIAVLASPVLIVAAAAGAMYAAFEIGRWQPVSDFFEKLGLEIFYGMSSAEAEAAVQAHHLADETAKASASAKEHADAAEEIAMATMDWKEVITTINPEIHKHAEELLKAGVSAKSVATETGLTAMQVKSLQMEMQAAVLAEQAQNQTLAAQENQLRLSKDELKQFTLAWESLNSLGGTFEDTLATINPAIAESVGYYAELGASVDELTKAFPGLTKAQAEAAVESVKTAREIDKTWTEVFAMQAKMHGDNISDFIKLETTRFNSHIEQLRQEGKLTSDMLDAERAKYETTIDAEIQKREQQITTSRAHYQMEVDESKAKLDLMLAHAEDFVAADIRLATQDYNEKARLLAHWATDANDKLNNVTNSTTAETDKQGKAIDKLSEHWNAVGHAVDKNIEMVRTLSGEVLTLKEYEAKQLKGGSQTYDLSTAEGMAYFKKQNPMAEVSVGTDYFKKGGTLETAIRDGLINLYANWATSGRPSYKEGGVGDFGEGTLAMLHGKEAIIPVENLISGSTPSGGGQAGHGGGDTHHWYVNGTGQQVADQVFDILMRKMKQVRKFGSA